MIFKKKKRMIDVRELQKRGVVRIPKQKIIMPTDSEGFVEFGAGAKPITPATSTGETQSNSNFFSFMSQPSAAGNISNSDENSSSETSDSYGKREVDSKIGDLDNKIYKLEQRIELLERKLKVNQPDDSKVGVMGW